MSEEYRDADQYLYVPACGFDGNNRKKPTCKWVNADDAPDERAAQRSIKNPYTHTYDETDPNEPHIIVGRRDGHMLDIDVDIGDDHAETFDGDIEDIQTPDGALCFRSASGGVHYVLKFERDHDGISGVDGVDIQGDMTADLGVVTSPFHHPDYEIVAEPTAPVYFDDIAENPTAWLNKGFGVDLVVEENQEDADPDQIAEELRAGASKADLPELLGEDDIREAIDHVDPDCPYPEWRNIGFGLVDFFEERFTAEKMFREWSKSGSKWDTDAPDLAERIIDSAASEGGGVTIGTVIKRACDGGWEMPTPEQEDGGGVDLDAEKYALIEAINDTADLGKRERIERQDEIMEQYAKKCARQLAGDETAVSVAAKIISDGSPLYTKTEVRERLSEIVKQETNTEISDTGVPFDIMIREKLETVHIRRTTDYVSHTTRTFLFTDATVETDSEKRTHNSWYEFRNEYQDDSGVRPAKPSAHLRSQEEWELFMADIFQEYGEERQTVGARTMAVREIQNEIYNSRGTRTFDVMNWELFVYLDDEPEHATEIRVPSQTVASLCDEFDVSLSEVQAELDARGHTVNRVDGVSERRQIDGERRSFWVLDADFAVPSKCSEESDLGTGWDASGMGTTPELGIASDTDE